MSKKSFIDSVEVKSPCTEDWEKMHGNDRVRFCDHCAKDVKNLSAVTRKEAMRLVRSSGGNLCIRYVQDPITKRPMFAEHLLQITRRTPGLAAGVITASAGLSALTYAQGEPVPLPRSEPVASCPEKTPKNETARASGKIRGTITDPSGSVIPWASVTFSSVGTGTTSTGGGMNTDSGGEYAFDELRTGTYRVEAVAAGFKTGAVEVTVYGESPAAGDIQLRLEILATVDVIETSQIESTVSGGIGFIEYRTPLASAVANEDVELVRQLIGQGEKVNGKDENYSKITPLFVAIEHGNIEIVQVLLDAGAKVNARDDEKQTPLMRLDSDATPELVEMLLRHGAKLNLTDNENNTALILAAENAPDEVVRALIDAGADVNVVNKNGQTALMNASDEDSIEKVKMLLEAGARVNLKNNDGETAWDLTSEEEIENLLVGYGAEAKEKPIEITIAPQEADPQEAPAPEDQ